MKRAIVISLFLLPLFSQGETYFGMRGSEGRRGDHGRDGNDGFDQTVRALGSPIQIDVSGSDGRDGYEGQQGEDAYNCRHNWPTDNMRGARGGNGGFGGDAGRGGNGGNVTVYYTEEVQLKNILIVSRAGRAGRAGRGGEGGYGCRCPSPTQWTRRICWKEKDNTGKEKEVCENRSFYCNEGSSGYRGNYGNRADDGQDGMLTAIRSPEVLPPDRNTVSVDFSYLESSSPLLLTKNVFKVQNGARNLLAPGSIVQNEYLSFSETKTSRIDAKWNSRRQARDFAGAELTLRLGDSTLSVYHPSRIWSEVLVTPTSTGYTVSVERILYENEADKLVFDGLTGQGRNLKLFIRDAGQVADQLNTTIWLKYESDGFTNKTRFEGVVPAQLVKLTEQIYEIQVGQLPIEEKYLKSGEKIKITVEVTRTLGTGSAKQKIKADFKVP